MTKTTAFSTEFAGSLVSFTPTRYVAEPLEFAVMIAKHQEGFFLVYNRYRGLWELPGGLIDPGETAEEAATREFFEETGQSASAAWLLGKLEVSGKLNTAGALYGGEVSTLQPFTPNEEIAELFLWWGQETVGVQCPGHLSELDKRLIGLYDACSRLM